MPEMKWHDRRERMPTREDADEMNRVWSWMDARGSFVISLRDFERNTYLHDWYPRIKQPRPPARRAIA